MDVMEYGSELKTCELCAARKRNRRNELWASHAVDTASTDSRCDSIQCASAPAVSASRVSEEYESESFKPLRRLEINITLREREEREHREHGEER